MRVRSLAISVLAVAAMTAGLFARGGSRPVDSVRILPAQQSPDSTAVASGEAATEPEQTADLTVAPNAERPDSVDVAADTAAVQPERRPGEPPRMRRRTEPAPGADTAVIFMKADWVTRRQIDTARVTCFTGNFAAHHNGTIITADSAIRYSDSYVECFGNVLINKNTTYIYGDRADYDSEMEIANVYAPIVKMVDGDATLYTYNFSFDTRDNIGTYHGGGMMVNRDNLLESDRGYYYADYHEVVCVDRVEVDSKSYEMKGDSVIYNMDTDNAYYFDNSNIWNDKGEYLYADRGEYRRDGELYKVTSNGYILTEKQEVWSDSIDYWRSDEHAVLRRNIQIDDTEHMTMGFGDYGEYWGDDERAFLTLRPSVVNYDKSQGDTLYMRSDSMFLYTVMVFRDGSERVKGTPEPAAAVAADSTAMTADSTAMPGMMPAAVAADSLAAGGEAAEGVPARRQEIDGQAEHGGGELGDRELGDRPERGEIGERAELPARERLSGGGRVQREGTPPDGAATTGAATAGAATAGAAAADAAASVSAADAAIGDNNETEGVAAGIQADSRMSDMAIAGDSLMMMGADSLRADSLAVDSLARELTPEEIKARAREEAERLRAEKKAAAAKARKEKLDRIAAMRLQKLQQQKAKDEAAAAARREKAYARHLKQLARVNAKRAKKGLPPIEDTVAAPTRVTDDRPAADSALVAAADSIAGGADSLARDSLALDSLAVDSLAADSLWRDSTYKRVQCYRDVRIYRSDFQARCDSLVAFTSDSTAHLYIRPVLWNGNNQITSEVMDIFTANQMITHAEFIGKPMMAAELDTMSYNQVTGKTMTAWFDEDGQIYRNDVNGNVETVYYLQDSGTGEITDAMYLKSGDATYYIANQQVETITYRTDAEGQLSPLDMIPETQTTRLQGFEWRGVERPERSDVFDRVIRASQRKRVEALMRPRFPISREIESAMKRLIERGEWLDRVDVLSPEDEEWRRETLEKPYR